MISPADIAAAKAVPIAEVVGAALELKRDYALCPFHVERSPSFHVHRPTNTFCCFGCGAKGDGIEFIRRYRGLDFVAAVVALSGSSVVSLPGRGLLLARPALARRVTDAPAEPLLPKILALWDAATEPGIVRFYLDSRNLSQKRLPEALRGHPAVWCEETGQRRPCVLAALTGPDGAICALQRVWVTDRLEYDGKTEFPKGARCSDLAAGKKTWGVMGAGAVRLAAAGETLGIAEGFETSLAAAKLFKIPVWAACGAWRMGSIELPEIVRSVVIFGDNGAEGEKAAAKAESLYRRRGYSTQCVFPEGCGDFAEMVAA